MSHPCQGKNPALIAHPQLSKRSLSILPLESGYVRGCLAIKRTAKLIRISADPITLQKKYRKAASQRDGVFSEAAMTKKYPLRAAASIRAQLKAKWRLRRRRPYEAS